jgi:hypothetical protein
MDIFAVQNSYAPVPVIGRFDGGVGVLLRGDGQGNFTVVPPAESGLVVPGDAKALVTLDLDDDGQADFVTSRNQGSLLAFRNLGKENRGLRILLKGSRGDSTAIGARVTAEYSNGRIQVQEVYAGSSYYSQSTPQLIFRSPKENPVKNLRVNWPNGAVSEYSAPIGTNSTLVQPQTP